MTTTTSGRDRMARLATLRRAAGLLNDFRYEQSDPARFYGALATDTADMVQAFVPDLDGGVILDVGGGPGYFADAFRARGAHYMSVEPDPTEMHAGGLEHRGSVRGSGQNLPFADDCIDVTLSSNVVEHTSTPWEMADDMLRVTRPGGVVIISYTLWWGPFGGHEMGLTHYLGGTARRVSTPVATAIRPRTSSGPRCSPSTPPTACAGRDRRPIGPSSWPPSPATSRVGCGGSCASPAYARCWAPTSCWCCARGSP